MRTVLFGLGVAFLVWPWPFALMALVVGMDFGVWLSMSWPLLLIFLGIGLALIAVTAPLRSPR